MDGIVITALDEIAWLLNLRGNDIAYSPVFKSYVYVSQSQVVLFVDQNKFKLANTKIRRHLSELNTDNCKGNGRELCVEYTYTKPIIIVLLLRNIIQDKCQREARRK